jgi:hypothetical protein
VRDITFACTVFVVVQYLHLWDTLRDYDLSDQPDKFKRIFFELSVQGFVCGEDLYCWR